MIHLKEDDSYFKHFIAFLFTWGVLLALIILDISIEIYHHICFSLYGLKLVDRGQYIKIDRYKLQYLNWVQKLNCVYCGYANGLLKYASVIAGETEKYWCGIKHAKEDGFVSPKHHKDFLEYNDDKSFKKLKDN